MDLLVGGEDTDFDPWQVDDRGDFVAAVASFLDLGIDLVGDQDHPLRCEPPQNVLVSGAAEVGECGSVHHPAASSDTHRFDWIRRP